MSSDIISKNTFLKVDNSLLPPEADESLWRLIINDCKSYTFPKRTVDTLIIALGDAANSETFDEAGIKGLLEDIAKYDRDSQLLFQCQCSLLCTKSLHPFSVMQSMSMVQAYMLPSQNNKPEQAKDDANHTDTVLPASNTNETHSSVSSNSGSLSPASSTTNSLSPASSTMISLSPASSTDFGEKSGSDLRLSDKEQTFLKPVCKPSDNDSRRLNSVDSHTSCASGGEIGAKESVEIDTKHQPDSRERRQPRMSKKAIQRREQRPVYQVDPKGDGSKLREPKHPEKPRESKAELRCARYTQQKTTKAVQNNPQVIYGKNVYISNI